MGDKQRFKAIIEYDGSDFAGYQTQLDAFRTVQAELEKGIAVLAQESITVWAAGRTDSGVHATGQVIAFDMAWPHGEQKLLRAINSQLPADVSIRSVEYASAEFSPRFDASSRAYRYIIERCEHQARRPLTRKRKWQVFQPLDIDRMNAAAALLVGQHDFATFGTPPQGDNTVRELFRSEWYAKGSDLCYEIEGTAFLYRMVRSIVGSLKMVGTGRWTVAQFESAFQACSRQASAGAAPAHGLYLVSVKYDKE